MNDVIYIRTSTNEQTPELQLKDIQATYPNSNNAIIFKEQNSAWKENVKRPEFEGVISMIKSRKLNS
ncbi:MAG: recombinase family protein, partial [Chitinophagaceae bacterium]